MLTLHFLSFTHYWSAVFTPWLLLDASLDRMLALVSWYNGLGISHSLSSVCHPRHDKLSPVLAQLFVSLFYDLGQALLPVSFFLCWSFRLVHWSGSYYVPQTVVSEQLSSGRLQLWGQEEQLAGWGGSSGDSLIDTAQVPELWNHSYSVIFCRSVLSFVFFP